SAGVEAHGAGVRGRARFRGHLDQERRVGDRPLPGDEVLRLLGRETRQAEMHAEDGPSGNLDPLLRPHAEVLATLRLPGPDQHFVALFFRIAQDMGEVRTAWNDRRGAGYGEMNMVDRTCRQWRGRGGGDGWGRRRYRGGVRAGGSRWSSSSP